jgi:hypothetical protein
VAEDKLVGAGLSIPRVVKFSYHDFRAVDEKWTAVCNKWQKKHCQTKVVLLHNLPNE